MAYVIYVICKSLVKVKAMKILKIGLIYLSMYCVTMGFYTEHFETLNEWYSKIFLTNLITTYFEHQLQHMMCHKEADISMHSKQN